MKKLIMLLSVFALAFPLQPAVDKNDNAKQNRRTSVKNIMGKLTISEMICGSIAIVGSAFHVLQHSAAFFLYGISVFGIFFDSIHFQTTIKKTAQATGKTEDLTKALLVRAGLLGMGVSYALAYISYKTGFLLYRALKTNAVVQIEEVEES